MAEPDGSAAVAASLARRRYALRAGIAVVVVGLVVAAVIVIPRLGLLGGGAEAGTRAGECPPPQRPQRAAVEYINFVRLEGREYLTGGVAGPDLVPARRLGGRVGTVRCTLSSIDPGPGYHPKDGDAGFLPAGSPLYAVAGYPATFRIAAPADKGRFRIYEADTNPTARTGADLLPIAGKVTSVEIRDGDTTTHVLGRTADAATVGALVAGIQACPVDQERLNSDVPLFVRFLLADGTVVQRAWSRQDDLLGRGIELSVDVTAMLEALLR